jgi:hypothetical protein
MGDWAFLRLDFGEEDGGVELTATVQPVEFLGNRKATGVGAGRLGHLHHTARPSLHGVVGN